MVGSSPHTRGALAGLDAERGPERIIPAYAGSTPSVYSATVKLSDHPRIRGEHSPALMPIAGRSGSSPHTRGAPSRSNNGIFTPWIIPAYAGSTSRSRRRRRGAWDHPRIRGEHGGGVLVHLPDAGIIPAYAGSTQNICDGRHEEVDHPRIRGEHPLSFMGGGAYWGSSPHTRGARPPDRHRRPGERIIPAYAGSTRSLTPPSPAAADHPRIRGEHWGRLPTRFATAGSSPHTRGAPGGCGRRAGRGRIIPAYAGSTCGT